MNDGRLLFRNLTRVHRGLDDNKELNYENNYNISINYDLAIPYLYNHMEKVLRKQKSEISSLSNALKNELLINNLLKNFFNTIKK